MLKRICFSLLVLGTVLSSAGCTFSQWAQEGASVAAVGLFAQGFLALFNSILAVAGNVVPV